ncbi:hypothetical protein ACS3UN_08660 [Oscillospiraceae bacterium LTW-04]|nr:hypothetical protein RBH76_01695 [Oscillospiraceae bacterium MB24-C1]
MKETKRKNILDLPYSLHDAHVNRIDIVPEQVTLWFDAGFYKPMNGDGLPVKGYVTFEDVDFDFCYAYLMDSTIDCGQFTGKKFVLTQFAKCFPNIDFEIIDETYGYNQSKFSGFFYEGEKVKECIIEIYHFGAMTYLTEE